MKTRLKKGDTVIVVAGKDRDKEGKILGVDRKNGKVIVEGLNKVTKHQKPNPAGQGGLIEREAPLHISNVMYSYKGKAARLGVDMKDGKKVRVAIVKGERIAID